MSNNLYGNNEIMLIEKYKSSNFEDLSFKSIS